MTTSPAGLERRYRRLLWAYPGSYRRHHGAEIVTTLLEMAEAGHGRPTIGQTLHLLACGLRQRFRLPARPLAWVAAVLATIAVGSAGAAGGTWLGWQTAADTPSGDQTRALTSAVAGNLPEPSFEEYASAMSGPAVTSIARGAGSVGEQGSAGRARAALTAAGWQVTSLTETDGRIVVDFGAFVDQGPGEQHLEATATKPARFLQFTATKDGLKLAGFGMAWEGDASQRLDVWAVETAAVRPLTIAGLLLGMLAGWLLTAAVAYRVRSRSRPRRRTVALLGATAFAAAVIPAYDLYRNAYQVMAYATGSPHPYIVYSPSDEISAGLLIACTAITLLAVAAAVLTAVRGTPDPSGPEPLTSG